MKSTRITQILSIMLALCAGATLPILIGSTQLTEPHSVKSEVPYCVSPPSVPEQATFDGETIDLRRYDRRERMDREMMSFTYMHSTTMLMLKRANRYFPIVEPILKANGIPDDFKYLMVIESSLNPIARSPSGAAGLWQFMPATGREFGLEVNDNIVTTSKKQPLPHASISNRLMPNTVTGWLFLRPIMQGRDVFRRSWTSNLQIMPWTFGWWKKLPDICSVYWQPKRYSAIRNALVSC